MNLKTPMDAYLSSPLALTFFQNVIKTFSPYQFNPLDINPLRDVLNKMVDFEELKAKSTMDIFICATNVKTGKIHIFDKDQLSLDSVLASACLPYVFKAVEIDKEYYWDGGYAIE